MYNILSNAFTEKQRRSSGAVPHLYNGYFHIEGTAFVTGRLLHNVLVFLYLGHSGTAAIEAICHNLPSLAVCD